MTAASVLIPPPGLRMIALDVDGTLVAGGDQPSPAVVDGLRAVREAGIAVVVATGRELHNVRVLCENIGADEMWAVCSNGSVTARLSADGEEVTEVVEFDPRPALAALSEIAPDLRFASEEVGRGYLTGHPFGDDEVRGPRRALDGPVPPTATLVICYSESCSHAEMTAALAGMDLHLLPYSKGRFGIVDISAGGASKASGVAALAAVRGITRAEVAAVGDYLNDVPMLEWAGWGVAMGHAPEEVISAADAVAPGIEDDGLTAVLAALARR